MNIPSFVGPLGCALVFFLTIFGICFYYCYIKPKRQNRNKRATGNSEAKSGHNGANRLKYSYHDDEFYYGLPTTSYSAGYVAYGGFPIVASGWHESRWTYPTKPEASSRIGDTKRNVTTSYKVRNESKSRQFRPRPGIIRELSIEKNRVRTASQLQVIQECDEEKEEEDNSETNREGRNEDKYAENNR